MAKQSAGILMYQILPVGVCQVLLVHPGGPFWKNKDEGSWSIPKGEFEDGEDPLAVAKREFREEIGQELPEGELRFMQPIKIKSGKLISCWCTPGFLAVDKVQSNLFELEWPPRSGKKQMFPEVDKAGWFNLETAKIKINKSQVGFIEELENLLNS